MLLTSFSPAEVKILLQGLDSNKRELLKLTLTDLFFRQVLKAKMVDGQFVALIGPRFNPFDLQPHERIFITPFEKDASAAVPLKTLARLGFVATLKGQNDYHLMVAKSHKLESLIDRGFWQKLRGSFKVNKEGKEFGMRLQSEIVQQSALLQAKWESNKPDALRSVENMNGCVMLLLSPEDPILRELEDMVVFALTEEERRVEEERRLAAEQASSTTDTYMFFDVMSDSFDSGGGDGGSGCGSDGGGDSGGGDSGCGSSCGGGCGGGD